MEYKEKLDEIQKLIFLDFKLLGFKKRGRTFNREAETGIIQVINFQSGQFPVGKQYEIPTFKNDYYGKFTVNLGVCVKELYEINFPDKTKLFYQEYDCQIRTRLNHLIYGKDIWWNLDDNLNDISETINREINEKGLSWFKLFESREKIRQNLGNGKVSYSPRDKLNAALIVLQTDEVEGKRLFTEYLNTLDQNKNGHEKYILKLAKQIGIDVF